MLGNDYIGTIHRLELIIFRIAMVLTVLLIMDNGNISNTMDCSDTDFHIAMEIVKVLLQRTKYIEVATQLQIPESTADKQIARFCNVGLLVRQTHGSYIKKTVETQLFSLANSSFLSYVNSEKSVLLPKYYQDY